MIKHVVTRDMVDTNMGYLIHKISCAKIQVEKITHKPIIQVFMSPVVLLEVYVKQDTPCQLTF